MRIDETRNDDFSGNVDFLSALVVFAGADDGVATYGDIRRDEFSGTRSKKRPPLRTMSAGSRPVPWSMRVSSLEFMRVSSAPDLRRMR